jgi:hypothetical protein
MNIENEKIAAIAHAARQARSKTKAVAAHIAALRNATCIQAIDLAGDLEALAHDYASMARDLRAATSAAALEWPH